MFKVIARISNIGRYRASIFIPGRHIPHSTSGNLVTSGNLQIRKYSANHTHMKYDAQDIGLGYSLSPISENSIDTNSSFFCRITIAIYKTSNLMQKLSMIDEAIHLYKTNKIVEFDVSRDLCLYYKGDNQGNLFNFPARPDHPVLVKQVPHHRELNIHSTLHILHSLGHVELNAVEMYLDTIIRFSAKCHPKLDELVTEFAELGIATPNPLSRHLPFSQNDGFVDLGQGFTDDMLSIVEDEIRHFLMVTKRLEELTKEHTSVNPPKKYNYSNNGIGKLDFRYGFIPATTLLWEIGVRTRRCLPERLAVIPLSQEARGLDAAPRFEERIISSGDMSSADIVNTIGHEEKRHVHLGLKWFAKTVFEINQSSENNLGIITTPGGSVEDQLNYELINTDWTPFWGADELQRLGIDPNIIVNTYGKEQAKYIGDCWREYVAPHFPDGMFPPFNAIARQASGLSPDWYIPLATKRVEMSFVAPRKQ